MKKSLFLFALLATSGCARFTTVQEERRFGDDGKLSGVITTRAASFTFFDSKSALANFKATQSAQTQSATVGSLNQETSGTNTVAVLEGIEKILKASNPAP
jgi:hypothetical protein